MWRTGPAKLGFGDDGEVTPLEKGPEGEEQVTFYFRHRFDCNRQDTSFPHPTLILRLLRDDGAIVYLNGTEIVRDNVSEEGDVLAPIPFHENYMSKVFEIPTEALQQGRNQLAVAVYQREKPTSKQVFSLAVEALTTTP